MIFWEYLLLILLLAWAVFYLWRIFFRKKGCTCDSCPSAENNCCQTDNLEDLKQKPCTRDSADDKD